MSQLLRPIFVVKSVHHVFQTPVLSSVIGPLLSLRLPCSWGLDASESAHGRLMPNQNIHHQSDPIQEVINITNRLRDEI